MEFRTVMLKSPFNYDHRTGKGLCGCLSLAMCTYSALWTCLGWFNARREDSPSPPCATQVKAELRFNSCIDD